MPDLDQTEGELDLRRIVEILRRRKAYVISTFLVVLGIAGAVTFLQAPLYLASADIVIRTTNLPSLQALGLPSELAMLLSSGRGALAMHIELIKSQPVLELLQRRLEADPEYTASVRAQKRIWGLGYAATPDVSPVDPDELRKVIQVRQVGTADMLRIEVTALSPVQASKIANHLVGAYQEVDRERARQALRSMLAFLDQKIQETRAQLNLSAEELALHAREIGMSWETQALIAKIARLEQLLAEAAVQLEDTRAQLETVEVFLVGVKEQLIEQFMGPEGASALIEISDKIAVIRKIQREISQLEADRERAFRAGDYIKAQALEAQIITKRKDIESSAAQQFKILEQLPQFEKLIQQQLELKLKVVALENRVAVIERTIQAELQRVIDNGLQLARLQRELDVNENLYTLLLTLYAKTRVAEIGETGSVEVVNPAQTPKAPFRPNKPLNLLVGLFLGILGGVGVAFAREALDETFRSTQEVEQTLGLPVLGTVPKVAFSHTQRQSEEVKQILVTQYAPASPVFEMFAALATTLRLASPDKPLRSILVTSPNPGAGKSTVAANLALVMAAAGKRVILVEADLRRPVLAKVFDLDENGPGLSELTIGDKALEDVVQEVRSEVYGTLHIIPAGRKPPNVGEFVASHAFEQVLARLVDAYDLVILDSPPVSVFTDALIVATRVTGVLLVLDADKTTKKEAEGAQRMLKRANAPLLGVVMNKVSRAKGGYYGAYYYNYYRDARQGGQRKTNSHGKGRRAAGVDADGGA